MKRDSDCLAIINLFRKIIASLACIINVSNNNDIVIEANKYILDFINQYNISQLHETQINNNKI